MERLFWVECPTCACRFYADYVLRQHELPLCCPQCGHEMKPAEAAWLDERTRG